MEVYLHRLSRDDAEMPRRDTRGVPNQPKTPHFTVRVPRDLWDAAKVVAASRGETLSDVVRDCLRDYVARYGRP
jgi:predicted HicB family RNase H-like nuclease